MHETKQAFPTRASATIDLPLQRPAKAVKNDVVYYDDTVRWPLWKSALLVLGVCGAFWGGVIYLSLQIF